MTIKIFCHSLVSDWNHGNAHFLRGIATELISRGHRVDVFEPEGNWSLTNLKLDRGERALDQFSAHYPLLQTTFYNVDTVDLDAALGDADLVLVHEWNDHELVARIGRHRFQKGRYRLLFHDTHHRSISQPQEMARYDLSGYDGVLAFGDVIRTVYRNNGWARRTWVWHEAADVRVFRPMPERHKKGDLVWIGNWGDDERTEELHEFLLEPVSRLGISAVVYGVRYPEIALRALEKAGVEYRGSLPNWDAPTVFASHKVTVHVPRRPYVRQLPGIPTIRIFEALACGIPLVSAPWNDSESLFTVGKDFLMVQDGAEMRTTLQRLLANPDERSRQADHGLETIRARHTCAHRVDELLAIAEELKRDSTLQEVAR